MVALCSFFASVWSKIHVGTPTENTKTHNKAQNFCLEFRVAKLGGRRGKRNKMLDKRATLLVPVCALPHYAAYRT